MSSVFFPLLNYYLVMSECSYGVLFQCWASPCVVYAYQLTLALYCAMTNRFVLFEYPCGMDHECDAKIKLN